MSAGASSSEEGGDFDLNLAPIIDCFVVLITYMLVSASFLTLDMLDIQLAATADSPADITEPPDPPTLLTVELRPGHALEVRVIGKQDASYSLPAAGGGGWDIEQLRNRIQELKTRWPSIKDVSMKAHPEIQYKQIVTVLENVKQVIPAVVMGE